MRDAASALLRGPLLTDLLFSAVAMETTLPEQDTARKCSFGERVFRR